MLVCNWVSVTMLKLLPEKIINSALALLLIFAAVELSGVWAYFIK